MAVVEEIIRIESDGSISFGNHLLDVKTKVSDFEYDGDIYKVKTYFFFTYIVFQYQIKALQ